MKRRRRSSTSPNTIDGTALLAALSSSSSPPPRGPSSHSSVVHDAVAVDRVAVVAFIAVVDDAVAADIDVAGGAAVAADRVAVAGSSIEASSTALADDFGRFLVPDDDPWRTSDEEIDNGAASRRCCSCDVGRCVAPCTARGDRAISPSRVHTMSIVLRGLLLAVIAVAAIPGCESEDVARPDPVTDAGPDPTDGGCTATVTCAPGGCGFVDDGCGAQLDCGPCACDADDLAGSCPSRPCEVAVGCGPGGVCLYDAVRCDDLVCACPADTPDCGEQDRRCAPADGSLQCPAVVCAASPREVDGLTVYDNVCAAAEAAACDVGDGCIPGTCGVDDVCLAEACGLCGLGAWSCDAGGAPVCTDLRRGPALAAPVCDSTAPGSSILFVDPVGGSDDATAGSRAAPLRSLAAAIVRASDSSVPVVVVAGSPTVLGPLELRDGVSVYGGFARAGADWTRDTNQRPVIHTDADAPVGVRADGIISPTVLSGLAVTTVDAAAGESAVGIIVTASPGLVLHDLEVRPGAGGRGVAGAAGVAGATGGAAEPSDQTTIGAVGENPACPLANGALGGAAGGFTTLADPGAASVGGAQGGTVSPNLLPSIGSPGQDGTAVRDSIPGASGSGGSPNLVIDRVTGRLTVTGRGTDATAGRPGIGGGGGGGGSGHPQVACRIGGAGGSGGAGGCGGGGGAGGGAGGASVALLAIDATGLILEDVSLIAAAGGAGGAGGPGGPAGVGGDGGAGGSACAIGTGGAGGRGSDGGLGGAGGGGAGGDSRGALCVDTAIGGRGIIVRGGSAGLGGGGGAEGAGGRAADAVNCGL